MIIGADFYETTHPYRLGRVAARLPETQFLVDGWKNGWLEGWKSRQIWMCGRRCV